MHCIICKKELTDTEQATSEWCFDCMAQDCNSMNKDADLDYLLHLVEEVTRSAKLGTTTYCIKESTMNKLKAICRQHLGEPYVLQGGKKIRPKGK